MSSSLTAVAGIGGAADPVGSPVSDVSVAGSSTPSVSAADAASFAREAAHIQQVQAPQPTAAQSLGEALAHRLESFSSSLQGVQRTAVGHARPVEGASHGTQPGLADAIGDAMGQLQGAYTFAIQTTLASRGSTESTKVFNTLLKGQ